MFPIKVLPDFHNEELSVTLLVVGIQVRRMVDRVSGKYCKVLCMVLYRYRVLVMIYISCTVFTLYSMVESRGVEEVASRGSKSVLYEGCT